MHTHLPLNLHTHTHTHTHTAWQSLPNDISFPKFHETSYQYLGLGLRLGLGSELGVPILLNIHPHTKDADKHYLQADSSSSSAVVCADPLEHTHPHTPTPTHTTLGAHTATGAEDHLRGGRHNSLRRHGPDRRGRSERRPTGSTTTHACVFATPGTAPIPMGKKRRTRFTTRESHRTFGIPLTVILGRYPTHGHPPPASPRSPVCCPPPLKREGGPA